MKIHWPVDKLEMSSSVLDSFHLRNVLSVYTELDYIPLSNRTAEYQRDKKGNLQPKENLHQSLNRIQHELYDHVGHNQKLYGPQVRQTCLCI